MSRTNFFFISILVLLFSISLANSFQNASIMIKVGKMPYGIAFDQNSGEIYIANSGSNNISVVDSKTKRVLKVINVGKMPCGVAIDSSDDLLYIANKKSGTISVINLKTNSLIRNFYVGGNPVQIAMIAYNKCCKIIPASLKA